MSHVEGESVLYEGDIDVEGVKMPISLHVVRGFFGMQQVGLKVNGEIVHVGEINFKRGGKLVYQNRNIKSKELNQDVETYANDSIDTSDM